MKNLLLTSAILVCFGTQTPAQSPSEFTDFIEGGIASMNKEGAGLTVGSREISDDGSLLLNDVVLKPEDGDIEISMDFLRLMPTQNEPGQILVTMSDTVNILVQPENDPLELTLSSSEFELVTNWVEDMAGSPVVSIAASNLNLVGGDPSHPVLRALNLGFKDLAFSFRFSDATRALESAFSAGEIAAVYDINDPTTGSPQTGDILYSQYQFALTAENIPKDEDGAKAFFDENGAFSLTGGSKGAKFTMTVDADGLPVSLEGNAGEGEIEVSLKEGVLAYIIDAAGFDYGVEFDPSVLPIPPFNVSVSALTMDFRVPMRPSDAVQEANLDMAIRDLALSDALWSIFDPEETIPRDPATLEIDLGASLVIEKPLVESFDEDGVEDAADPTEVATVSDIDVTTIFLSAGGAEIAADGRLDVINDGPIPMPEGAIDISLKGLQGLANSLAALGLVDQQQVGMAMGMMMAFAKPGDAADEFTSKIEFTDGSIIANGIPVQ